jgi:hypothetical protein
MRQAIWLTILAFVLLLPVQAGAQISSDLDVVLVDQTPLPGEPGANMDIEISLQNDGFDEASNLAVEIMPATPFSLVKGDRIKTFTRIGARSTVTLTYTLLVDAATLAGDYDLDFRIYNQNTPTAYSSKEIEINVLGETKLIVGDVTTTPGILEPGGRATIHVTLDNVGTGDARQLEIKMNSSSDNLVPILSGGLVYLDRLNAGESKTVDLNFNIDPDADQDTYLTTLSINYKDENNARNTVDFSIGIPVEGTVLFEIVEISPSFTRGSLDIEVANRGTGDAKSVEASLLIDGKSVGVDYLSQLKATKKTTFNFPLALSGNAELVINYVEPGLAEKVITKDLGPLNFAAPGGDGSSTLVFLFIIAVIGFFVWRRYFRKKK